MPDFDFDNHRISYDEYGEGDRPIVLIHGLLMNRRMFDRLGPEMAQRGNRVITLDLLGHGRSDRPPEMSLYSMTFFARQVEALLDHLGLDQAVVGGTSLGANATLELNHVAPERVKAMMIEMPVLDNALLAAAVIFTPIMVGLRFGEPVLKMLARGARRIPRTSLTQHGHWSGSDRTPPFLSQLWELFAELLLTPTTRFFSGADDPADAG